MRSPRASIEERFAQGKTSSNLNPPDRGGAPQGPKGRSTGPSGGALLRFTVDGDHGDIIKLGGIVDMIKQIVFNPLNQFSCG